VKDLLPFVVVGLTSGSVYGLAGVGLVLTYKTSGVFNFGHGALATVSAFVFYALHVQAGIAWPLAALISVGICGALMGLGLEQLTKRLARAGVAVQIVSTVGVVLVVQAVCLIIYGTNLYVYPQFLPTTEFDLGGTRVSVSQIVIFGVSLVATLALVVFFRRARLGKAMRAVVEDPDLLDIAGTNPSLVRRVAWMIGATFAGISGVLLAPSLTLDATVLTLLVIQAFGAAAIGRFVSIPATWLGGLGIGLGTALLTKYFSSSSAVSIWNGLPASLPFIVLFIVIMLLPRARLAIRQPPTRSMTPSWTLPSRLQLAWGAIVLALFAVLPSLVGFDLGSWTVGLTAIILFLSLGLLVRTSGQVSLCSAGFAAIGVCVFSRLTLEAGVPWLIALLIAGLAVVPVGALLAIPAIRFSGIFLALATLGFGFVLQDMFYQSNLMFGAASQGITVPTPYLSWLPVGTTTGFYYVVLVITVLVGVGVYALTQSRLGRLLRAMSDSPTALATSGTSIEVLKVSVFCISAFIAGISGALLGATSTQITGSSFDPINVSLLYLAVIVISVGGTPWYAILPGVGLAVIPLYWHTLDAPYYLLLIFGYGAISHGVMGRMPVPPRVRQFIDRIGGRAPAPDPDRDAVVDAAVAAAPVEGGVGLTTPRIRVEELEVRDLTVTFGGLRAVCDLSLTAPAGRITGLIGPNGAGKTTTFNACCGLVHPTSGSIWLRGRDITAASVSRRARLGLGRTFQQLELYESQTVAENIAMGREGALTGANPLSYFWSRRGDRSTIHRTVGEVLDLCGITRLAHRPVASLPTGERRLVELARCLASPAGVLLLDEPSAGLDQVETARFGEILSTVVAQTGVGILLVEHDMELVMKVCDELYVLDFGSLIFRGTPSQARTSELVRAVYLGTDEETVPASTDSLTDGSPI
jgi:ABC-type branched-subunit amino acid transport system ATPase component/branched-subunit amino acid ABC-type transport system permease component